MRITIEIERPRHLRKWVAVLAAAVIAIGGAGVVTASHLFDDVPTTSQFHTPIAAIARAGITSGCGNGDFCPKTVLTREQEAAFLHRGLSRIAMYQDEGPLALPVDDPGPFTLAQLTIVVPGSTALGIGANQFVKVDARMTFGSQCPAFSIELDADSDETEGVASVNGYTTYAAPVSLTTSHVFAASPGSHTYYFRARATSCGATLSALGSNLWMIATTHTFGDAGTDVLHCQSGFCPSSSEERQRPAPLD